MHHSPKSGDSLRLRLSSPSNKDCIIPAPFENTRAPARSCHVPAARMLSRFHHSLYPRLSTLRPSRARARPSQARVCARPAAALISTTHARAIRPPNSLAGRAHKYSPHRATRRTSALTTATTTATRMEPPRRAAPPALAFNDPEPRHDTTALNRPSAGLRWVARSRAGSASSDRFARGST